MCLHTHSTHKNTITNTLNKINNNNINNTNNIFKNIYNGRPRRTHTCTRIFRQTGRTCQVNSNSANITDD